MGLLVALFGVLLCVEAVLCQSTGAGNSPSCNVTYPCSNLFCGEGGFLQEVNEANIFADPKSIVDLPLKLSPNTTLGAFQQLLSQNGGNASAAQLQSFVDEYFGQPGSDLLKYTPPDFTPVPPNILPSLPQSSGYWNWSLAVHQIWPELSRTEAANVSQQPDAHSLLPLPNPFVIAGDRFREQYYWDSYWIIRGLLISNMSVTALDEVANLLALLRQYGHVPNGARSYYINRSQPPLLSQMVRAVYEATSNVSLLSDAVPLLVQEHTYWTTAPKQVTMEGPDGQLYNLSRYYAEWDSPRPESFAQDRNTSAGLDPVAASLLYRELASGAESGQDFSSRWFADGQTLATIRTTHVIPADLNAFLLQMERNIAFFANVTANFTLADQFTAYAASRQAAIDAVLWSPSLGRWTDFVLNTNTSDGSSCLVVYTGAQRNGSVYAADYVPLWAGALPAGDPRLAQVVTSLNSSGLILPGGITTSLNSTNQQWDYPNAWPPLNHMIIEGLATSIGDPRAPALASDLAVRYLRNVYTTYYATGGLMSEKLDAAQPGTPGGGGEYKPQVGFGWSNGVALDLLNRYGSILGEPPVNGSASNGTLPSS